MQFTTTALAMAGLAAAHWAPSYNSSSVAPVYTTEVVTAYTTFCPQATQITHGTVTYTATESETLTITNCPCTVTKPVSTSVVTVCSTCAPVYTSSVAVVPPPYPSSNATTSAVWQPTGTEAPTTKPTSTGVPVHNSGSKVAGAGILAIFGLVAAL